MESRERQQDEQAICALKDIFVRGFLTRDAKLRASIWTEDGTLAPPTGGFFQGRAAIEKDFEQEIGAVTETSKMSCSNYRFRFITDAAAFVDADLTINDVRGSDGNLHDILHVKCIFLALKSGDKWFIQDERAHFHAPINNQQSL